MQPAVMKQDPDKVYTPGQEVIRNWIGAWAWNPCYTKIWTPESLTVLAGMIDKALEEARNGDPKGPD